MPKYLLLDFTVYGHFLHDRVEFLQLQPVRSILPVLLRHVARSTGQSRRLMFGTLQNNLMPISFAFLSHFI